MKKPMMIVKKKKNSTNNDKNESLSSLSESPILATRYAHSCKLIRSIEKNSYLIIGDNICSIYFIYIRYA